MLHWKWTLVVLIISMIEGATLVSAVSVNVKKIRCVGTVTYESNDSQDDVPDPRNNSSDTIDYEVENQTLTKRKKDSGGYVSHE